MRFKIALLVLAFVLCLTLAISCRQGQAGVGQSIAGTSPQTPVLGVCVLLPKDPKEFPAFASAIKQAGFGWVQTDIPLSRINPREGVYEFNYGNFEVALKVLRQSGLHLLLKFLGQADWISPTRKDLTPIGMRL